MLRNQVIIVFTFLCHIAIAQCDVQPSILDPAQSPLPSALHGPPIPYPYVRQADIIWSKRVWRMIDLKEKINQPLYYPTIPNADRRSMWDAIYCAVKNHEITIYSTSPFDFDKSFDTPMTKTEADSALERVISVTDSIGTSSLRLQHLESPDIIQYMLKEVWFFDKQRSVMDVRILGICPFAKQFDQNGDEVPGGLNMLFWIYFPDIRPVFAATPVFNPHNTAEYRSLDEIFMKRMFSSYMVEESNVYNRRIGEYMKNPMDALLEAERLKNEMFNIEHDMWQY